MYDSTFLQSGRLGDLIYALNFIKAITNQAHLYLGLTRLDLMRNHPLGTTGLTRETAEQAKPLLLYQDYISKIDIHLNQKVDYNLDVIRTNKINTQADIRRWLFYYYPEGLANYNHSEKWLTAPKDEQYKDMVICSKTTRYTNRNVNWQGLAEYKPYFIGLPGEYIAFRVQVPTAEYLPVKDYLEMATIINSCKFAVCNQTFAWSLAQGLDVPRLFKKNEKQEDE